MGLTVFDAARAAKDEGKAIRREVWGRGQPQYLFFLKQYFDADAKSESACDFVEYYAPRFEGAASRYVNGYRFTAEDVLSNDWIVISLASDEPLNGVLDLGIEENQTLPEPANAEASAWERRLAQLNENIERHELNNDIDADELERLKTKRRGILKKLGELVEDESIDQDKIE